MPHPPNPIREIPFSAIEATFRLAGYWYGPLWCPPIERRDDRADGGFVVRVLRGQVRRGEDVTTTYDYFVLSADGTVEVAPRGYARDYKPARITGLDDAVAKYASPPASDNGSGDPR